MVIRVLFVCLGNICRSPMAEAVFRDIVQKEGLAGKIRVDSAGTGHWHVGEQPHRGTRGILDKNKIDYTGIVARQVNVNDFSDFQYIVAMDSSNVQNLKQIKEENGQAVVKKLMDFVPDMQGQDVPDPYYTGNFDEVYQMVHTGCTYLLDFIRKEEQL